MIVVALSLVFAVASQATSNGIQGVPFTQVKIADHFWSPRQEVNRSASVGHCFDMLEKAGNLHNFELAAQGARTGYQGFVFNDSDVYKVLEGASYILAGHPDAEIETRVDAAIKLIAGAQEPDGYVDTYYEVNAPDKQFTNLEDNHELYCAGHLLEAAVAHYQATGKRSLLDIGVKYANLLYKTFGPGGLREGYGGHPELELALVKLSHATEDDRYFKLAQKLIDSRGSHFFAREHKIPDDQYDGTYFIDDVPLAQQKDIKGHAVRAAYLMSGATDVVRQTGDPAIEKALDRVWNSAIDRRVFLTGGIGPSGSNEGFTTDYDLPNLSAYQETCASVAMAMWGYRMGMLHGDAKYFDAVENALDNAMLAGVSQDGKKFFYVNPLASLGNHHREPWFGCACCPPNALRTIASVGGYAYGVSTRDAYVNLYLPGSADLSIGGHKMRLDVQGDYPWDGRLKIVPHPVGELGAAIHLRVPGWCHNASVSVDGNRQRVSVEKGYVVLDRTWKDGDSITLDLPMPIEKVLANPQVKEDIGRQAVRRGPLVYCAEGVDQTADLSSVILDPSSTLKPEWKGSELGGIVELSGIASTVPEPDWRRTLYQPLPAVQPTKLTMIPYCDWDNRKAGPMEVWFPTAIQPGSVGGLEARAKVGVSFLSENAQPEGINDGSDPKSSGEQPTRLMHWWPHKGTQEWVSYTWTKPIKLQGVKVYWFDDTGHGECRLPASWSLEQMKGGHWTQVSAKSFPTDLDRWDEISFDPIETTALRLVVQLKPGWAAGVRQWRIVEPD